MHVLDRVPRVVITGLGAITPIGNDVPTTWQSMLDGRSGIGEITRFDIAPYEHRAAAEVRDFDATDWMPAKHARRCDRVAHWSVASAKQALADASITIDESNAEDVGIVFGSGGGGQETSHIAERTWKTKGLRFINPYAVAFTIADSCSGVVAIETGARGYNVCVTSACSTGTSVIGEAAEAIRRGEASVIVAGASENPILELIHVAYTNMRGLGLPLPGEHVSTVCRPFDRTRNGFVLGEGAAALVLESLDHALARGARIYAEVLGYGATADAFDMVVPAEGGEGAARAMRKALARSRLRPEQISMINPHGTSTPIGDKRESEAIWSVFGSHTPSIAVSATKSLTGHMMGAAGTVEGIATVLGLYHGVVPGTLNYREPDPECRLNVVTSTRPLDTQYALSNSLGLGGHNAAVVFARWDSDAAA